MLKYTREQLKEKEIENLIIKNSELIEDGLKYIDHQRKTASGRLDVLFIDINNTLVVAELKVVEDDNMLIQALDYYDFIYEKIEGFTRIFPKHKIDVNKYPRLMLIAPVFSTAMINRCKWLRGDIQISLVQYQYIKFKENKEDTLVFIPQEISAKPTIVKNYPSIAELLNYIKLKEIKILAEKLLNEMKAIGKGDITIDPLQWGKSIKYKGYVLCYWEPKQTWIRISCIDKDGNWSGNNITNEDEYIKVIEDIKRAINKYK